MKLKGMGLLDSVPNVTLRSDLDKDFLRKAAASRSNHVRCCPLLSRSYLSHAELPWDGKIPLINYFGWTFRCTLHANTYTGVKEVGYRDG